MKQSVALKHYLFLLRYALRYQRLVLSQLMLMVVSIGFALLKPWPLKVLVDNVVGDQSLILGGWRIPMGAMGLLVLACAAYLIFHVGEAIIQFSSTTVAAASSSRMIRDLRSDVMDYLQRHSLKFHDSHRLGDLVHRVSYNTAAVETAFQSGFMGVIKSTLTLVGMFIVMVSINPLLTLVAVCVVPLLLLTIRLYAKRTQEASRRHQDQEGRVHARAHEILSSIRLVQAFTREAQEKERFRESCDRSVDSRLRMTFVQNAFTTTTGLTLALGTVLLYAIGIQRVMSGALTIGEFLVFNAYLAMLYAPLSVLSYTSSSVQSALGGGSRLFEILEADPEIADSSDAMPLKSPPQELSVKDMMFGYEPDRFVLKGINFELKSGEMLGIVGETGGG